MTVADATGQQGLDPAALAVLFRDAHTTYSFTDEQVSDAELAEIYDLVRHAPTAMNTQPLRIVFVRSRAAKDRLLPLVSEGNRVKVESAPVTAILAADLDFHEHLPLLAPHMPNAKDRFADDEADRERTARFNATLQAGYAILAIRALGLDAGPMGGFDRDAVDREFFAGTPLRALLLVNIGHAAPDGTRPRSPRLEHGQAVTIL